MRKNLCLLLLAATLCLQAGAEAQISAFKVETEGEGAPEIEVAPVFANMPSGFIPYRVTIHNRSSQAGSWELRQEINRYRQGNFFSHALFQVEAGQTRTFEAILASPMSHQDNFYGKLHLRGSGVSSNAQAQSLNLRQVEDSTGPFAASGDLEVSMLAPYRAELSKSSQRSGELTVFNTSHLPHDWRAYLSFQTMLLSGQDWAQDVSPEVRNALRQWVGAGGKLIIVAKEAEVSLWDRHRLNADEINGRNYGAGNVKLAASATPLKELVKHSNAPLNLPDSSPLGGTKYFIIFFSIGFAALMGPLNFFVFAPSAKRHRLFVTIPLISLVGATAVLVFILLKDGVGGSGTRHILVQLLPETHEAVIHQAQSATTGLLLSRGFQLEDNAVMVVRHEPFGKLSVTGNRYEGDWFKGRSVLKHQLTAVRSSRMAITLVNSDLQAGEAPEIISSFEQPILQLLVSDAAGDSWSAENVQTGQRVKLTRAAQPSIAKGSDWFRTAFQMRGLHSQRLLEGPSLAHQRPALAKGHFIAQLAHSGGVVLETLPSIRWTDQTFATGPLSTATPDSPSR